MALSECFQWNAHRAESRKHGCCPWRPYRAVLPTCKYFHFSGFLLRTQFSLLSCCSNSSNFFSRGSFSHMFSLYPHDFLGVVFTGWMRRRGEGAMPPGRLERGGSRGTIIRAHDPSPSTCG